MNFPKLLKQLPSSSWSTLITIESLNSDNQRLSSFCYSEAWSSVWPISAAEALLQQWSFWVFFDKVYLILCRSWESLCICCRRIGSVAKIWRTGNDPYSLVRNKSDNNNLQENQSVIWCWGNSKIPMAWESD